MSNQTMLTKIDFNFLKLIDKQKRANNYQNKCNSIWRVGLLLCCGIVCLIGVVPPAKSAGVSTHWYMGGIAYSEIRKASKDLANLLYTEWAWYQRGTTYPDAAQTYFKHHKIKGDDGLSHNTSSKDGGFFTQYLNEIINTCGNNTKTLIKKNKRYCREALAFFFGMVNHVIADAPWHQIWIGRTSGKHCPNLKHSWSKKPQPRHQIADTNEILREIHTGTHIDPDNTTIAEFLREWLNLDPKHRTTPKTFERYQEIVEKYLIPALGQIKLAEIKPAQIQKAYSVWLDHGRLRGQGGLSPTTVRQHHRVLSRAFKQAVRWGVLSRNPADAVDPPPPVRREIQVLTHNQLADLLEAAQKTDLYLPVLIAATTGLRLGEVFGLWWKDLDLENGALTVNQTLQETKAGISFKPPKTPQSRRTVALPAITVDALKQHWKGQCEAWLVLGSGKDMNELVNADSDGAPISPKHFNDYFNRIVKAAGVPRITFHGLRHTHLTHLLQAGVHPKVASERAGHTNIGITLDLYSHVMPGMQEDAAAKIDTALQNAIKNRK